MPVPVDTCWLGRLRFQPCWELQLALHRDIAAGKRPSTLLLVEHEPVITLGRRADESNLYLSEEELTRRGIDLFRIERGGDVTYHGPGQLMGYPLLNLRVLGLSVIGYVRALEESLIALLAGLDIPCERIPGMTGVWHRGEKMAAIGIAVRGGVSYHGFALNVSTDLSCFDLINPCGLSRPVTSIEKVKGTSPPPVEEVARDYMKAFAETFGVELTPKSADEVVGKSWESLYRPTDGWRRIPRPRWRASSAGSRRRS